MCGRQSCKLDKIFPLSYLIYIFTHLFLVTMTQKWVKIIKFVQFETKHSQILMLNVSIFYPLEVVDLSN